jgi:sec-independent protein translocase protein TatA
MNTLAFGLGSFDNPITLLIIAFIALMVFGKRLPEVGRSLGKGIVEFKKGLKGIDEEIEEHSSRPPQRQELPPQAYRAPLAEGGDDRRVSRADVVEQGQDPHAPPRP